jgi:DDE superfamily endonuclease
MLLAPIPWAGRVWALPFLTCLAPSERSYQGKVRAHKKVLDWGRQMIMQLRRWLPDTCPTAGAGRQLVIVADSEFAAISWLFRLTQLPGQLCLIVRLRLDAALYQPAPKRTARTKGRPRKKGDRLPTIEQVAANPKTRWQRVTIHNWYGEGKRVIEIVSQTAVWFHNGQPPLPIGGVLIRDPKGKFKTQALLCTDQKLDPVQIIKWFNLRWQVEVTYHEVREHLGVETQRQWSDLATLAPRAGRVRVARTTPTLLGLFSLVTLMAHQHARRREVAYPADGVVSQGPTDLQRCIGIGAQANLATYVFWNGRLTLRQPETFGPDAKSAAFGPVLHTVTARFG